jgi:hypothetical protein
MYHTNVYESKAAHQLSGCCIHNPGVHQLRKATEIQLHPRNFNREAGFTLSWTWQPIINMLKHSAQLSVEKHRSRSLISWLHPLTGWLVLHPKSWLDRGIYTRQQGTKSSVATPEDGDRVSLWNGEFLHLDAAVCPRCYWIMSPQRFQDIQIQHFTT